MIIQTIGEVLTEHVTLDVEGIDRLYLNAYQPRLQTVGGVAYFFRQHNPLTRDSFPWMSRADVMCNQYYCYVVDEDFGPLFIKFSSYFPYTARINLNGHEFAKRQLAKAGIAFEALNNGLLSCADPAALQGLLDGLTAEKLDAVVRKWFARLPQPFTAADRAAGFRYELSILQAEFARTQVFDRPLAGRHLFETMRSPNRG